jgi:hypothetical protein
MIIDHELEFSDGQTNCVSAKSANAETQSTNVLDLTGGNAAEDGHYRLTASNIGDKFRGGTVYWNVEIGVVLNCTGASVLEARLWVHSAATSVKSGNRLATLRFPVDAAAGTIRSASIPNIEFASTERYMGVTYFVSGGTQIVSGAVNSWLSSVPGDTQIIGSTVT